MPDAMRAEVGIIFPIRYKYKRLYFRREYEIGRVSSAKTRGRFAGDIGPRFMDSREFFRPAIFFDAASLFKMP